MGFTQSRGDEMSKDKYDVPGPPMLKSVEISLKSSAGIPTESISMPKPETAGSATVYSRTKVSSSAISRQPQNSATLSRLRGSQKNPTSVGQ